MTVFICRGFKLWLFLTFSFNTALINTTVYILMWWKRTAGQSYSPLFCQINFLLHFPKAWSIQTKRQKLSEGSESSSNLFKILLLGIFTQLPAWLKFYITLTELWVEPGSLQEMVQRWTRRWPWMWTYFNHTFYSVYYCRRLKKKNLRC